MPESLDQPRSLTELINNRARDFPDAPAFYTSVHPVPLACNVLNVITYSQFNQHVDRLAWHYARALSASREDVQSDLETRIIAVLVPSSIYECLVECALAKLACCALLLSVNNSATTIAHLCKLTKATALIWGGTCQECAAETAEILSKEGIELKLLEEARPGLWDQGLVGASAFNAYLEPEAERNRPAVILHSSGSTGFPKPIYVTHSRFIANVILLRVKPAFSALPVFHGLCQYGVFRAIYSLTPFTLFPPYLPLTATNMVRVIDEASSIPGAKPSLCLVVPYIIKLMSENEASRVALSSFDIVYFGGAALPDDLGDRLVYENHVNLLSSYAATETGLLMTSIRQFETDKSWNWLRPLPSSKPYLAFENRDEGVYELIVKAGFPPKNETNREDGSYATKDLFQKHPQQRDWYKYVGRLDDTIVQNLGEKTNPVPLELCIRGNSPYVSEAIVFGAGRPYIGVLILPSALAFSDGLLPISSNGPGMLVPDEDAKEYFDKIWSVIEQANCEAPSHSRISREMVGVLSYGTEVPVATKMSILRPACYKKFGRLIDAMYNTASPTLPTSSTPELDIPAPPARPTALEDIILSLIRSTTLSISAKELGKENDLFEYGVDSLQSARVRNGLQKLLGQVELGQNVVYEHPSVSKLARHIVGLVHGHKGTPDREDNLMLEMVEKHVAKLVPQVGREAKEGSGQVVLLTGATGSLGAHILSNLLSESHVDKVICFSRAKSHHEALLRVKCSTQTRQLEISEDQWDRVISYAADTTDEGGKCGLNEGEWEGLKDVSVIIHNAWPVNFNISLSSYATHISGATYLMNLARSIGARFFFSSSVAASQILSITPQEFSDDTGEAMSTGYGRSKWVTEKIMQRSEGRVGVLRIGQLVGDSKQGVWNESEALPLMIKSASVVGALPLTHEELSLLPVDIAGSAIAQLALKTLDKPMVYHIVHPGLTGWDNMIIPSLQAAGLTFERVETREWLERLRKSDDDAERNPARKLLEFYGKRFVTKAKNRGLMSKSAKAYNVPKELAGTPPISMELVGKWVKHWKQTGFL